MLAVKWYMNFLQTHLSNEERKKKMGRGNQEAISEALKQLKEFEKKHSKPDDAKLKKTRKDLQNRFHCLRKQTEGYDDKGLVINVVAWHDGYVWRVAVDTQGLEGNKNVEN